MHCREGNAGTKHILDKLREAFYAHIQLQHVCQGREDEEIPSACTDDGHFSHIFCLQRAKQVLSVPLPTPPNNSIEFPELDEDLRLLTTYDCQHPYDNCHPLLCAQ